MYLNLTIDKTSSNNPIYPSDGTGVGTLSIAYSLANGGNLKISNDNPKFTLSQSEISTSDCNGGSANITISYNSDEAGTDYAHLVIYNDVYRKEVTVTGITVKRDQVVTWEIGDAIRVGTEVENAAWVTTLSAVTYTSSNTNYLDVVNGKLVAKAEGVVTVTADAPGNAEYNNAHGTKTITVTNDLLQEIVWNQNLLRLKLGGENQTLNAYATSDVEGCTTNGTRPITYESSNESVVKVVNNNQLQIMGAGKAVLTARQAGGLDEDGHKYMAVSKEMAVIVRDPNAPCDNYLYVQPSENEWYCGWNHLDRQYKETVFDNLVEPSDISLKYKGEYKTVLGVNYFYGTMLVEEWYDEAWHTVEGGDLGTPEIGNYKSLNADLHRNTTKVRISTHDGVGYHYYTDCKIGQSRYIETSALSNFEAKVGQAVQQTLTIRYNNITGPVTMTLPENTKFTVSQNTIDGDCGDKGTVNVTISYLPTVEANETETLTISDGTTTRTVNLHGIATRTGRHIAWDLDDDNDVYTENEVELTAQVLTDVGQTVAGDIHYAITSSSPAGVAEIAGTTLRFMKAGTVVISASTDNDARYNDLDAMPKTFYVAVTPTTISSLPVLAAVPSGKAVEDVELTGWQATSTINGAVVAGTLEISDADLTTVGTNTVTLTFTPDNTAKYATCTGTTTIVVNELINVFSGEGDWDDPANWSAGIVPTGNEPEVIISGELVVDEPMTISNLTIEENGSVSVKVNGVLTVTGQSEDRDAYGDIHVEANGTLILGNEAEIKVNDFIIDASLAGSDKNAKSGQVTNAENIVQGNVYFDLSFDPSGRISYGWYDFVVPFEVNMAGGIARVNSTNNKVMVCGQDFLIMEADGVNRSNGGKGWRQFNSGVLQPGKLYTITFDDDVNQNTFRFQWNGNGSLNNGSTYNAQFASASNPSLCGWNGLGNGMLRHGHLEGSYKMQVYNHADNRYELMAGEKTIAVGTAFFVQVSEAGELNWTASEATNERPMYAPARVAAQTTEEFCIALRKDDRKKAEDILYFSASEDATNTYMIGHDLTKMGTVTTAKVAQMWTEKNGLQLCDVETPLYNGSANTPLMFFAPQAGEYSLSIEQMADDATLYLTYNGNIIWDLTFGPYDIELMEGTNNGYGLLLEAHKAPQITTGVDETDAQTDKVRKVMIDNQLYLISPEGQIYDATGKKMR